MRWRMPPTTARSEWVVPHSAVSVRTPQVPSTDNPSARPVCNRELHARQDEFELYNHLDDEWTSKDNHNAIKYCERRLQKLRFSAQACHIKSCLAHLE